MQVQLLSITFVGQATQKVEKSYTDDTIKAIKHIEYYKKFVSEEGRNSSRGIVYQIGIRAVDGLCNLRTLSLSSQAVLDPYIFNDLPKCLLSGKALGKAVEELSDTVGATRSTNRTTLNVVQLPDGRKFAGLAADKSDDKFPIHPEIMKLHKDTKICPNLTDTNGKCGEAKALSRALEALGGDITKLRGATSVAILVRSPTHKDYRKFVDPCERNCLPVLEELGIKWPLISDLK